MRRAEVRRVLTVRDAEGGASESKQMGHAAAPKRNARARARVSSRRARYIVLHVPNAAHRSSERVTQVLIMHLVRQALLLPALRRAPLRSYDESRRVVVMGVAVGAVLYRVADVASPPTHHLTTNR